MKVREFIKQEIDIDVYDDVCEELAIAFFGPQGLTEEGKKHFAEVLDYDIEMHPAPSHGFACAIVNVDGENWKHKLAKAKEFFDSAAGYCAADDYDKWFMEVD